MGGLLGPGLWSPVRVRDAPPGLCGAGALPWVLEQLGQHPSTLLAPAGSLHASAQGLGRGIPRTGGLQIKFKCPIQCEDQRSLSEAEALQLPGNCPLTPSSHVGCCTFNARAALQVMLWTS